MHVPLLSLQYLKCRLNTEKLCSFYCGCCSAQRALPHRSIGIRPNISWQLCHVISTSSSSLLTELFISSLQRNYSNKGKKKKVSLFSWLMAYIELALATRIPSKTVCVESPFNHISHLKGVWLNPRRQSFNSALLPFFSSGLHLLFAGKWLLKTLKRKRSCCICFQALLNQFKICHHVMSAMFN